MKKPTAIIVINVLQIDDHAAQQLAVRCDHVTVSLDSAALALHDTNRSSDTHRNVTKAI